MKRATGPGETIALYLAGLLDQTGAAERLRLDPADVELLLTEVGLSDAAVLPVEVDRELTTAYLDIGRCAFAGPQFDDEVERVRRPDTIGFRLTASALLNVDPPGADAGPTGLILHTGRCGSTLLGNLLTSVPGWVVLNEPELVNTLLLRTAAESDRNERVRLGVIIARVLVGLAHGVRHDAAGRQRKCVVKLTSWNAILEKEFLPHLARIPLVVVTRDPWSTVASLVSDPPHWYGEDTEPSTAESNLDAVRFFSEAWRSVVEAVLRLPPSRTMYVSFSDLVDDPTTVLQRIVRHLGHDNECDVGARVDEVVAVYAKSAVKERFDPEGRHRRAAVDEDAHRMVTEIAGSTWLRLLGRDRRRN